MKLHRLTVPGCSLLALLCLNTACLADDSGGPPRDPASDRANSTDEERLRLTDIVLKQQQQIAMLLQEQQRLAQECRRVEQECQRLVEIIERIRSAIGDPHVRPNIHTAPNPSTFRQ